MTSEEEMNSEEKAEYALRIALKINKDSNDIIGDRNSIKEKIDANRLIGKNILREETGYFGGYTGTAYNLDEPTRNLLLAHGRQDAAHSLCNTISMMEVLNEIKARQRVHTKLLSVALIVTIVIALKVLM
jgi:hypothetical protein